MLVAIKKSRRCDRRWKCRPIPIAGAMPPAITQRTL
jgi:hypothetical protein